MGGAGGTSLFGSGGPFSMVIAAAVNTSIAGVAANPYGAGGSGGLAARANQTAAGGAGKSGVIMIWEFK